MTRAGHTSYATTRHYINLAGEFRQEAELAEERMFGATGYKKPVQNRRSVAERVTALVAPDPKKPRASGAFP